MTNDLLKLKKEFDKKNLLALLRDLIQKLADMDSIAFARKNEKALEQIRYLEKEAIAMSSTITFKDEIDSIDNWAVVGLQSEVLHALSHLEEKPKIGIMIVPVGGIKQEEKGPVN